MKKVLVIGSNGQLGQELYDLVTDTDTFKFVDVDELDITSIEQVLNYFSKNSFDFCVNCAAYTAVDKAEEDSEKAEEINRIGVGYLSEGCKKFNVILIHISTDFVFDGKSCLPLNENSECNPLSVYGHTKRKGELEIMERLSGYFIIRTSWLYSSYGNNFVKTMIGLAKREELSIISDQMGTPTYARDLAELILHIIEINSTQYGLYHYSNEGVASWYDFAHAIFEYADIKIRLKPIFTTSYPTPAERPKYSVLDKSLIKNKLSIDINHWRESLKKCINKL